MHAPPAVRDPHPCIEPSCGHGEEHHVPTPELAATSEQVVFCSVCHRHEVGPARSPRRMRRRTLVLAWALPLRPV